MTDSEQPARLIAELRLASYHAEDEGMNRSADLLLRGSKALQIAWEGLGGILAACENEPDNLKDLARRVWRIAAQASCDTRRMAETGNTGSVRSTGGAVPSEAQADAQPSSPSPPRSLKQ